MTTAEVTLQQAFMTARKLHQTGQLGKAATLYQKILQADASHAAAMQGLGLVYYQSGQPGQAVALIGRAIELEPAVAYYHNNLGTALASLGKLEAATKAYSRAVELDPMTAGGIKNLCACLHELGKWEEEIEWLVRGLEASPNDGDLLNDAIKTFKDACRWDGLEAYTQHLLNLSKEAFKHSRPAPLSPYHSLTTAIDPVLKKQIAENYALHHFGHIHPAFDHHRPANDKIRIGYVSADFRDHPTAHLIAGLFRHHDREKFEVYAYSYGPNDGSPYRKEIEENADHFIDLFGHGPQQISSQIYTDKIDILMDVMGYIQNGFPAIFASRPAPVQVSYLAYPGTMGAPFIDYLVADHVAIPPYEEKNYSEQLIMLPGSYFITDDTQAIAATPSRRECGLPEQGFVFCCFNKSSKISEEVFDCWMQILKEVPKSVLWLLADEPLVHKNLRKEARARRINPDRLIFAERLPKDKHLARHAYADLFLDCFTVCAHTTAIDALYASVPVLTRVGNDMISRASASILHAVGLPELVAPSTDAYKAQAIAYATDRAAMIELKNKLAYHVKTKALFNTKGYVRELEKLLLAVVNNPCR